MSATSATTYAIVGALNKIPVTILGFVLFRFRYQNSRESNLVATTQCKNFARDGHLHNDEYMRRTALLIRKVPTNRPAQVRQALRSTSKSYRRTSNYRHIALNLRTARPQDRIIVRRKSQLSALSMRKEKVTATPSAPPLYGRRCGHICVVATYPQLKRTKPLPGTAGDHTRVA